MTPKNEFTLSRLGLVALALSGLLSAPAQAENDLESALSNAKVSVDLRTFYFDRNFDKPGMANATALTAGGIAKVETGSFHGVQIGLAYYGNYLVGLTERAKASGTSLLESGTNDDLSFLGEAYAKFSFDQSSIQIGQQRLATPLANDRDLRLLPTTYRAVVVRSKEVPDTHLEAGWITGSSKFGSTENGFADSSALWGTDGIAYAYVENSTINNLKLRGQYAKALDTTGIKIRDYRYADARFSFTKDAYIEGQYAGNGYQAAKDSAMYGFIAGINFQYADFAVVYNKITDNTFSAINAGPMYTDWQQGYANYEPSEAVGAYVVIKPMQDLSIKLGSVAVTAKQYSTKDDYLEHMIDATLLINKANRIRVRYSVKDQSDKAYIANPTYPDRTDLRVIYSYSFSN
jgi:hypothetical protein